MSRVALVTGASGFVGSHLVDQLCADGWEVRALVRRSSNTRWLPAKGIELVHGDATDPTSLPPAVDGVNVVFHVAGVTRAEDEAAYFRVNAQGTGNLVRVSQGAQVERFVLVSSLAAGGPSTPDRPRSEEDKDRPSSVYGRSKLAGEEELIREAKDLPWTILRPAAVFGPRDVGFFVLARIVARGWKVRFSGPIQPVSVIHVRDLVDGILAAALSSTARGKKYYMANRKFIVWKELSNLMAEGLGRQARDLVIPRSLIPWISRGSGLLAALYRRENSLPEDRLRDLFTEAWTCDSSRAGEDFGFLTSVDLTGGIQETMQWYKKEGWI